MDAEPPPGVSICSPINPQLVLHHHHRHRYSPAVSQAKRRPCHTQSLCPLGRPPAPVQRRPLARQPTHLDFLPADPRLIPVPNAFAPASLAANRAAKLSPEPFFCRQYAISPGVNIRSRNFSPYRSMLASTRSISIRSVPIPITIRHPRPNPNRSPISHVTPVRTSPPPL